MSALEVLPLSHAVLDILAHAPNAMRDFVIAGLPEAMPGDAMWPPPALAIEHQRPTLEQRLDAAVLSVNNPPETKSALLRLRGATAMSIVVSKDAAFAAQFTVVPKPGAGHNSSSHS